MPKLPRPLRIALLAASLALTALSANAHKPSDSYLTLEVREDQNLDGRWDIALRDLEFVLGLDADHDAAITWGELKAQRKQITDYALSHLRLRAGDSQCTLQSDTLRVADHVDGAYAVLGFSAQCPQALAPLKLDYSLLFDVDPGHRGLLQFRASGTIQSAVLAAGDASIELTPGKTANWDLLLSYLRDGAHHIWIGYDHILFLLTLLLPAVLVYRQRKWQAKPGTGAAVIEVVKLVTAFTVAHSITLALAVFGWLQLPSWLVESVIALSILVMALNNLRPLITGSLWLLAFGFGLIHGLGFASVLIDLGLPTRALALALLGFNVGVELGQLAIVLVLLPAALLLRGTAFYRIAILQLGSSLIAALAAWWLWQRLTGV